jgi:DNA replication protein DnaC
MSEELLQQFKEAYSNLELVPLLTEKEINQFKVEYAEDVLDELVQLVEDCPNSDGKIVFTGHRGCGKSTLLAEFGRNIEDKYFVVFFSIAETIEMLTISIFYFRLL